MNPARYLQIDIGALAFAALALWSSPAAAEIAIGAARLVVADVSAQTTVASRMLATADEVRYQELIATERSSAAVIQFVDGTELAIGEQARVRLDAFVFDPAWLRFIIRHPGHVFGLYALNALAFLMVMAIWMVVAPGAGGAGAAMWLGFVLSQIYLLARLFLKLQFIASQTALFQATLAHAAYTAAPSPVWPDSPSAELVRAGG